MKTFAEMLKDKDRPFTQDMRDAVEAFDASARRMEFPLDLMRSTPPAKEPVSVESVVTSFECGKYAFIRREKGWDDFKTGDRVRVVRIEEPQ